MIILKDKIQVVYVANSKGLGKLHKEDLRMSGGDADCNDFINKVLENRSTSIHLISDPNNIPYGIDYHRLGDVMYLEEKEIFKICIENLKKIF